ncbi:MAG: type I-U CRISPR-associated protein Csx17 [Verrucomicrobia bacterium]|nr:type I-U CRISPR-associated protein Csx17 [Verrucomicrobiota bacterium]
MPILPLPGCAPIPLAHYLKALGVLRLVAEDREHGDPAATGRWERDVFLLHSRFERQGLLDFFLHQYQPTPILAPWNGGSGFYPKDNTHALSAIEASQADRLVQYRAAITAARGVLAQRALKDKPGPGAKEDLLRACRNQLPDAALAWLDAAFVLTAEGAKYPPLLGTGGNDGRLEFTNNFMQRLVKVVDPTTGAPAGAAADWLCAALFGGSQAVPSHAGPAGQFLPGAAGGANTTRGFASDSAVNPWDYLLMLEGALLFAVAAVRRLEGTEPGALAYPFCVRQSGVGYGSASAADEQSARAEIWLPLWHQPSGLAELAAVFSEGRAQVGARAARHGVDFARAVVSLGVDRGIAAFQRMGFQVRNGLAYFATPLDRLEVRRNARADLLGETDLWLDRFRRAAGPNAKQVPAAVSRALHQVESRILELCKEGRPARVQTLLVALGQAERTLARSFAWTTGRNDKPPAQKCAPLSALSARWLHAADDGSPEFRLAAALSSVSGVYQGRNGRPAVIPLRQHLEPVALRPSQDHYGFAWDDPPSSDVVWHEGDFVDVLNAIFARRLIRAAQAGHTTLPDSAQHLAPLADVVAFLQGLTDDDRLAGLVWGLCLLGWPGEARRERTAAPSVRLGAPAATETGESICAPAVPSVLFSLLRLTFPRPGERGEGPEVPANPMIHRQASAGHGLEASRLAIRRLRGSGLSPALGAVTVTGEVARRAAAALLFPLSCRDFARLADLVLKPQTENRTNA